eukprot:COSAG01_NODE_9629_length_2382_cov_235.698468_2_plen_127_part_00
MFAQKHAPLRAIASLNETLIWSAGLVHTRPQSLCSHQGCCEPVDAAPSFGLLLRAIHWRLLSSQLLDLSYAHPDGDPDIDGHQRLVHLGVVLMRTARGTGSRPDVGVLCTRTLVHSYVPLTVTGSR